MPVKFLKEGRPQALKASDDAKVKATVEGVLADIEKRGEDAVREYSQKFDQWNPESFKLTKEQIDDCFAQLSKQDIEDIKFAQEQVRNFARIQKSALQDIEKETLPGIILGHKNIPIESVGAYVPGGAYPLIASAHMAIVTAKVAGCPKVIAVTPPFKGKPAPAVVVASKLTRMNPWRFD